MCNVPNFYNNSILSLKYLFRDLIFLKITYIDEPLHVALLEVEEDRGIVEVGQVRHVLAAVVLRGVHLVLVIILQHCSRREQRRQEALQTKIFSGKMQF